MPRVQATEEATIRLSSEERKPIIEVPTFEVGKANLFYKHTDLAAIVMLPKIMREVQVHSDIILDRLICLGCVSRESEILKEVGGLIQQILLHMYTEALDLKPECARGVGEITYDIFCDYLVNLCKRESEELKAIGKTLKSKYGYHTREGWALAKRICDFLHDTICDEIADSGVASLKQDYIIASSLTDDHQLAFFDFSRFSDPELKEIATVGSSIFKSIHSIAMDLMETKSYEVLGKEALLADVNQLHPEANIEEALDRSPWLREVVENIVSKESSKQLFDSEYRKKTKSDDAISAYTHCCWVTRGVSSAPRVEQHEELKDTYEGHRISSTFEAFNTRINLALGKPQGSYYIHIETSDAIYVLKNLVSFDVLREARVSGLSFDLKGGEYTTIIKFN